MDYARAPRPGFATASIFMPHSLRVALAMALTLRKALRNIPNGAEVAILSLVGYPLNGCNAMVRTLHAWPP